MRAIARLLDKFEQVTYVSNCFVDQFAKLSHYDGVAFRFNHFYELTKGVLILSHDIQQKETNLSILLGRQAGSLGAVDLNEYADAYPVW